MLNLNATTKTFLMYKKLLKMCDSRREMYVSNQIDRYGIWEEVTSSEYELVHFDTTDLHDLQSAFYSIDFSADRIQVWNTNYLQKCTYLTKQVDGIWDLIGGGDLYPNPVKIR